MNNPPTTSRAPIASAENLFIHTDASVNISSSFSTASIRLLLLGICDLIWCLSFSISFLISSDAIYEVKYNSSSL